MCDEENIRRWRLILGEDKSERSPLTLSDTDRQRDEALSALYEYDRRGKFEYQEESKRKRGKGMENSSPSVARWLGDIRTYFSSSVVEMMQNDAMGYERLKEQMILEPEILEQAEPTIHLVATLMELGKLIPKETKETARMVVKKVTNALLEKLEKEFIQSINGALSKNLINYRPTYKEINWHKTILQNLKHYQAPYKTIIPQKLYGYGRKSRRSLKDIIVCLDQSGSMGTSVIYSAIFGSVMASLPTLSTKMVVFDTNVVDLTKELDDPVDLLFGVQLGGGTNINKALGYAQTLVNRADDTILLLISDLEEGGSVDGMLKKVDALKKSGVEMIVLLALNDEGTPFYDKNIAKKVASLGVPIFACTPDIFPDLMACMIEKRDIKQWASQWDITFIQ